MRRPTAFLPVLTIAAVSLLSACASSGSPPAEEEPAGEPVASVGELQFTAEAGTADFLEDVAVFFGANRRPARALGEIRDTHNKKDWTHRLGEPNVVARTRDAVKNLARSDYATWDETAMVVAILSTLASLEPSALVRSDCLETLDWFGGWISKAGDGLGRGPVSSEDDVLRAMNVLFDLSERVERGETPENSLVVIDAVAVLGNHPWSEFERPEPRLIRTRLSRPRGVTRLLTSARLEWARRDPDVRDTMDRALIRLAGQVIRLTRLAALGDDSPHVRSAAARGISADESEAVGTLLFALEREDAVYARLDMVAALGRVAGPEEADDDRILEALARVLSDPDLSVRRAASRELARITELDLGTDPSAWQRWWRQRSQENL